MLFLTHMPVLFVFLGNLLCVSLLNNNNANDVRFCYQCGKINMSIPDKLFISIFSKLFIFSGTDGVEKYREITIFSFFLLVCYQNKVLLYDL